MPDRRHLHHRPGRRRAFYFIEETGCSPSRRRALSRCGSCVALRRRPAPMRHGATRDGCPQRPRRGRLRSSMSVLGARASSAPRLPRRCRIRRFHPPRTPEISGIPGDDRGAVGRNGDERAVPHLRRPGGFAQRRENGFFVAFGPGGSSYQPASAVSALISASRRASSSSLCEAALSRRQPFRRQPSAGMAELPRPSPAFLIRLRGSSQLSPARRCQFAIVRKTTPSSYKS